MAPPASLTSPTLDPAGVEHLRRVVLPALIMGPRDYLDEVAARLAAVGVQRAVAAHDTATLFRWLMGIASLQGISDEVALGWDARHGGVTWAAVRGALDARPSCPRLRSHQRFVGCGYRKGAGTCAEPAHLPRCPVPRLTTRKGGLAVAAFSLALFIRDVCADDLVAWLDASLAHADPGLEAPDRATRLAGALVRPLAAAVTGIGLKVWSIALSELLLAGDPGRERWVAAGSAMISIDSLLHNLLNRTGTLRRCRADHPYGPRCYAPRGCADLIRALAETVDARVFNAEFPTTFPRWIQHSLWQFCSTAGGGPCNGRRIDDRGRCRQRHCPAYARCDRIALHAPGEG